MGKDDDSPVIESSDTWEYGGVTYSPGDRVELVDRRGSFKFKRYEKNTELGTDWIWVNWEGHFQIAVRPARVKPPKKKTQRQSVPTVVLCPDHKKYTATRKPRTDCPRCWAAYEAKKS